MERRDFLKVLATGAAATQLPACGGWSVNPPPEEAGGPIDGAGRVLFTRDQYASLNRVGGAVLVKPAGTTIPLLLVRVGEDDFRATTGLCTHVQCPVGYVESKQIIECPCHGAQFGLDGGVLRKPATTGLTPFAVREDPDSGKLYIDTRGLNVPTLVNGVIEFAVTDLPQLEEVDGFVAFTPTGMLRPIILARYESRRIFAADAVCTYNPCVLDYAPERRRWRCSCHSCEYDLLDGAVRQGPAQRALRVLDTVFDGTTVRITVPS